MKLNITDEQGIELLNFIFEREFKPPFKKGGDHYDGDYPYYNLDNELIGYYSSRDNFMEFSTPIMNSIHLKVCTAFGFPHDAGGWGSLIEPHLKPWMENQINIKLDDIFF